MIIAKKRLRRLINNIHLGLLSWEKLIAKSTRKVSI